MPGISRAGMDTAGNTILTGKGNVRVNGMPVAHIGSAIANHCSGSNCPDQHTAPVIATGSGMVRVGGIPVCRAGDSASCGHSATGSGNVRAG